jgi:DNA gyrase subunit A
MATSIPPHNLREICAATVRLIRDPEVTEADLVRLVPGPDFPTGGIICGRQGCQSAALTGRGTIVVRGRVGIDEHPRSGRQALTITEIPFQVNKARLVEKIAELVREKRVQGIADLRDESDRDGIRVVVELKRDAVPQIVLNQLYKLTPLQESFGVINLSIVDGRPRVLSTRETLQYFVDHRRIVVTRRTRFELREAEARAHILEGLVKALDHIDEVVQVIRASKSPVEARSALMERFDLSERQAQAILDMRLARLTGLERDKILAELEGLRKEIARLQAILADSGLLDDVIVGELEQIAAAFGEARRTEIVSDEAELDVEDLIQREDMVVTISHQGFIKRNPLAQYRAQRRGGKGVSGMEVRQEDFVRNLFVASTHAHVLFFSNRGRVHARKVYEVPEGGRTAKGRAIVNLVGMEADEKVAAVLVVSEFAEGRFVVTATRRGYVKKTPLLDYANAVRQRGLIGLNLDEDDQLIAATVTDGAADILLGSRRGLVIRFPEAQARSMGRGSRGVRGMAIGEDDEVVSMEVVAGIGPAGEEAVGDEGDPDADAEPIEEPEEAEPEGADGEGSEALGEADAVDPGTETVLTVCANGFGKRTPVAAYRRQRRGGKGLIDIKTNERNGPVVAQLLVGDGDHIMVVSTSGTVLRCPVREVPHRGRNTMGVRLIRLADTEQIVAVERWAEAGENVGVDEAAAARVPDEGAAAPVEAPGEAAADVDATDSPPDDDES